MMDFLRGFIYFASIFYISYLTVFVIFSFFSVAVGAYKLYVKDRMLRLNNKLDHGDLPVSIIVPAYNESVTIVDSINSLLALDYRLYEIVIIDDGSQDDTAQKLIDEFELKCIRRPIHRELVCQPEEAIYEAMVNDVNVTLICKKMAARVTRLIWV